MPKYLPSNDDVPIVCETCLGDKDFVRMTRDARGAECKLCNRPFVVFRWQPAKGARRNVTRICGTCSSQKGACQCCILDLTYRLPLAVRDAALKISSSSGTNEITRKYNADTYDSKPSENIEEETKKRAKELLERLAAKTDSTAATNESTQDTEQEAASEASRIIKTLPWTATINDEPNSTASLFIMGIEPDLDDQHLRSKLNELGTINHVNITRHARCGFVTFSSPDEASKAAATLAKSKGLLVVDGNKLRLVWGEPVPLGKYKSVQQKIGMVVRRFVRTGTSPVSASKDS